MKKLLTLIAALVLMAPLAKAQEQEPSLKPSSSKPRTEVNPHVTLQISYNGTTAPAYLGLGGPDPKPRWMWVTRFARLGGVEVPGLLPIRALRVESQFNGEAADTRITLLRGHDGHEQEDQVAVYHVGINEEVTVEELKSFGIEPISLSLLNTVPLIPPAPTLNNPLKSVEIVSVISEDVSHPSYKLSFKNVTEKKIRAVKIDLIHEGRTKITSYWANDLDRPLEPGGVAEKIFSGGRTEKTANGYRLGVMSDVTLAIRTVIFQDLSFEGDEAPACQAEPYVISRRFWLKRMVAFLDRELAAQALSPTELKQKFLSLRSELETVEKTNGSVVSSTCPNPDLLTHISPQNLSLQFSRDLDRVIKERSAPPINFRSWLESKREDYKTWLANLQ